MNPSPIAEDVIYLDHAATTPVSPDVLTAMLPYFSHRFGNPSSMYQLGQESRAALDETRSVVAQVLNCQQDEVIFTSGATESDNLALRGVAWANRLSRPRSDAPHIVTTAIEHHAVLHAAEALERQGFTATYVAPDSRGLVDADVVAAAIRPETCLISVMYANNETGAIQSLRQIADVARAAAVPLHSDAVQAAGSLPLDVDELGVDLLSLSAHKFYGPKGAGVLYVRRGTPIDYQLEGGSQEQGRRGGTENVPALVGLGLALAQADAWRRDYARHCASLRDRLWNGIRGAIPDVKVNGPLESGKRLPNNLNVSIPGVQGETVLLGLDLLGIAASAGSACTTGNTEPSHVLRAMGVSHDACRSALRFTVGRGNSESDVDTVISAMADVVGRSRRMASIGVG